MSLLYHYLLGFQGFCAFVMPEIEFSENGVSGKNSSSGIYTGWQ